MQEDSEEDNGLGCSDFTVDSSRVPESTSEECLEWNCREMGSAPLRIHNKVK